jgi:hypothetical protein
VTKKFGPEALGQKMEVYNQKVKTVLISLLTEHGQGKIRFVTLGDAWYNNFLYR